MKGGSRRNPSSDMMNTAQISISAIRMTIQKAPMIGTCFMNIREGRKPNNICEKVVTTALNALQLLLWPQLYEEDLRTVLSWLPQLIKSQRECLMGQVLK